MTKQQNQLMTRSKPGTFGAPEGHFAAYSVDPEVW